MSLNKFMHTRNPFFKNPPNYAQLGKEYPEFAKFCQPEHSKSPIDKLKLDYNDPEALRALYYVLMKHYFKLHVTVPINHLIPRVPQRVNYILWIEDLLAKPQYAIGIDIGSGASCVYGLLACSLNPGWQMLASDISDHNLQSARTNIEINGLNTRIFLQKVEKNTLLIDVIKSIDSSESNPLYAKQIDFVMCNPPFFASEQELMGQSAEIRKPEKRHRPHSVNTARLHEAVFEDGGEVGFLKQMIEESVSFSKRIKVFTSMLGKKKSLLELKAYLNEKRILNVSEAHFCQGHTMRWGLAWSFEESQLPQLNYMANSKEDNKVNKVVSLSFEVAKEIFPADCTNQTILEHFKNIFIQELQFEMVNQVKNKKLVFKVSQNTWANQRAKRRKLKFVETAPKTQYISVDVFMFDFLVSIKGQVVQTRLELILNDIEQSVTHIKDHLNQIVQYLKNNMTKSYH